MKGVMMGYIEGTNRKQIILFPESVDDYIEEDNSLKFIEAFIENLDLKELGFLHSELKPTGRPPYNPKDMLKLYIYGYLNRIRSSRRLESETKRNVELMWLLKKLTPDFKTIADFRKDNPRAIRKVCREFILLCKKLDLFGSELVAIDGSKFRASNAKKQNFTRKKLNRSLKEIDKKIDRYLCDLEEADEKESKTKKPSAKELKEKIEWLKSRKNKYQELKEEMDNSSQTEVSLTDPDARSMMDNQRVQVCYNVQTTVDAKHKLILDCDLTNEPADQHQLTKMAKRAKALLEVDTLEVLADKGYYDAREIKSCTDNGVKLFTPKPASKRSKDNSFFLKEEFTYNESEDVYICPAAYKLSLANEVKKDGEKMRLYASSMCQSCHLRNKMH